MLKNIGRFFINSQYRARLFIKLYIFLLHQKWKKYSIFVLIAKDILSTSYKVFISNKSKIGRNIRFPHPMNIIIGDGVIVGDNCTIYHGVTLGQNKGKFPILGNNVIVYAGAKILGDVHVGNNAIIGANAVVVKDVLDNQIVGGVPAKVIGVNKNGKDFY